MTTFSLWDGMNLQRDLQERLARLCIEELLAQLYDLIVIDALILGHLSSTIPFSDFNQQEFS
jgi:hypothetical protein